MLTSLDSAVVDRNGNAAELYERVIRGGDGRLAASGALVVETGQHTGRSPADKFVVRDASTEPAIWWDNTKPMSPEAFATLRKDHAAFAAGRPVDCPQNPSPS